MADPRPLTNDEGEVRELAEEDFARFVPFTSLPAELQTLLCSPKHIATEEKSPSRREPAA